MEIIKLLNGKYYIINETWKTRNAWGHKSTLLINENVEIASHKVKYINRTWESYEYQACMLAMVKKLLNDKLNNYITDYKEKNATTRLTKKEREQLEIEWKKEEQTQELLEIIERIEEGNFE